MQREKSPDKLIFGLIVALAVILKTWLFLFHFSF